jgi:CRISPR system Cascade subunit CasA
MPFSLIHDPWIPALDAAGERHWIAPHQITERDTDGALRWHDLDWGRPDLRIASYELLIGLFAVALDPQEGSALRRFLDAPPALDTLRAALVPLSANFRLDGDGPRFLQDRQEIAGEANPPDALFMDAPGANTIKNGADFFVKRGRMPVLSCKAAAIALYALQAFAPSGGAGHRTSMRGGGPLTTLVVPPRANLWTRIAANLPYLGKDDREVPDDLTMVFPWARETRVSRGDVRTMIGEKHGTHWLQHYFGMPRRIRLDFAANTAGRPCALTGEIDETVVTGFRMEAYGINYEGWHHPLTPHYRDKANQTLPVHPQSGRIGYREWFGYLFASGEKGAMSLPAEVVPAFTELRGSGATLLAAGYVTDNMKTEDYVEAEIPLLALGDGVDPLFAEAQLRQRLLVPAEMVARELRGALIASLGGDFKKTTIAAAVEAFWIATEGDFREAIGAAVEGLHALAPEPDPDTELRPLREAWLVAMRRAALSIFRQPVSLGTMGDLPNRQREAIITANRFLHMALFGRGKSGQALFAQLGLPPAERKPPRDPDAMGVSP